MVMMAVPARAMRRLSETQVRFKPVVVIVGPFDSVVSHSLGSFTALYTFHRTGLAPADRLVITGTPGEVSEFFDFYRNILGLSKRAERVIRETFKRILDQYPEYFSAPTFVTNLHVPGLIIHDHGDPDTPIRHAETIHKNWQESVMIKTNGLGHNLRSAQVVKHIVDFLAAANTERLPQPIYVVSSLN